MDYIWVIEQSNHHRIAHTQGHRYRIDEALLRGVPFRGVDENGDIVFNGYFVGNREFDKDKILKLYPNVVRFELKNPRTMLWEPFDD